MNFLRLQTFKLAFLAGTMFLHASQAHAETYPPMPAGETVSERGTPDSGITLKQTVYHPGSKKPQAVRTTFSANNRQYLTNKGHFVLYEYFRLNGTLEQDILVDPEPSLGGGVISKYRVRTYDATGKQIEERYLRKDMTLGVVSDMVTGRFIQYRTDGKTLRLVQENAANGHAQTYYCKDGKTPWWTYDKHGNFKVFFDLNGKPINRSRTSNSLTGGSFSMSSGDPPKPYVQQEYWREDKTLEYRQTWYRLYDGEFVSGLAELEVFAADGKTMVCKMVLEPRKFTKEQFIKETQIFNADGTKLVRKYASPGCRQSEELFDASGKSLKKTDYPADDKFKESVDESYFHELGSMNPYGPYDDDSHDF